MDVQKLKDAVDLTGFSGAEVWFRDDDGNEYPIATAELDFERHRLVLVGETA